MKVNNQSRALAFAFLAVSVTLGSLTWSPTPTMALGNLPLVPGPSAAAAGIPTGPSTGNFGNTNTRIDTPVVNTPPPAPVVPVIPPTPPAVEAIPTLLPLDVTHTTDNMNAIGPQPTDGTDAMVGISETKGFPAPDNLKGSADFILIIPQGDSDQTSRKSPYVVALDHGTVLAAVRRPSQTGLLQTEVADVAFSANSDAFVSFDNGLVRIRNVDGMGQALKVKINKGPGTGIAVAVAPGYEMVLATHKLTREDMRPNDGIARRGTHLLDGGCAAVNEYNVEGALQASSLVAKLTSAGSADTKSKRIVSDMSRMAAVLNQMNGTQGFAQQ